LEVHPKADLPVPPYSSVFLDNFTIDHHLDPHSWFAANGPRDPDARLENSSTWFEPDCVEVLNGSLRLFVGQNGQRNYTIGRLDSSPALDLLYGEVEWRMKLYDVKNATQQLRLTLYSCDPETRRDAVCNTTTPAIVFDISQ